MKKLSLFVCLAFLTMCVAANAEEEIPWCEMFQEIDMGGMSASTDSSICEGAIDIEACCWNYAYNARIACL